MKHITHNAQQALRQMGVTTNNFLRIKVINKSCLLDKLDAAVDTTFKDDDTVLWDDNGITVIADIKTALFVDKLVIDIKDGLLEFQYQVPMNLKEIMQWATV